MRDAIESPASLVTEATAESALVEMLLTLELTEEETEAAAELCEARAEVMLLDREATAEEADWGMEFWACFFFRWLAAVDGITGM